MALNILVVDDSATVRAVIVKTLELAEIPVNELHQAADGQQALDIAFAAASTSSRDRPIVSTA